MQPKFSIIIGVYNHAKYLPGLFVALETQTFKDFEVHFCDDGSDDVSQELLRNACWSNMDGKRWYYHRQSHQGTRLAKNLNQGIKAAKGEYCVFIMGDSMPEMDYLEILSEWVRETRMICGIRVQIDEIGGKIEGVDMDWRLKKHAIPAVNSVVLGQAWSMLTGNGLTIPTKALREHGGWCEDIEGYGGDDKELIGRMYLKAILVPWSIVDLRLYHHWHPDTKSNQKNIDIASRLIQSYAS